MQTSNVKMVVQKVGETAAEFATQLEDFSNFLIEQNNKKLIIPPVVTCTAASDGRQTAMIQYFTDESKGKKMKRSKSQSRINDFLIAISGEIEDLENSVPENELTSDQYVINQRILTTLKETKATAIEILKPTV